MSTNSIWVSISCADLAISRDPVEARVGDRDAADVGLDRAERIIRRLRRGGLGQRIEKRRFADVRQADDAAAEAHDVLHGNVVRLSGIAFSSREEAGPGSSPG